MLDDPAGIHDRHLVRLLGHHPEVVRDEDHRHAVALAQRAQEIEDLRLDGDVQRGGGLVGDQHARLARDGDGDHHPLPHAAREAVRVVARAALGLRNADLVEQLDGAAPRGPAADAPVQPDGLGDLAADGEDRIERGHRLLEYHRQAGAADGTHLALGQPQQIAPLEAHVPADDPPGRRHEPHEGERSHRLAAARLADQAEHSAALERERHAVDRAHHSLLQGEDRTEVAHLEERPRGSGLDGRAGGHGRVTAASSGTTRPAGGGAKSAASTAAFGSAAS